MVPRREARLLSITEALPRLPPTEAILAGRRRLHGAAAELQRWQESRSAAPKLRGGSVSPPEKCAGRVLAVIAEHPDLLVASQPAEALH